MHTFHSELPFYVLNQMSRSHQLHQISKGTLYVTTQFLGIWYHYLVEGLPLCFFKKQDKIDSIFNISVHMIDQTSIC